MKLQLQLPKPRLYMAISSPKLEIVPFTGKKGLFSAVSPTERTKKILIDVAKQMGFDVDPDSLHITVVFSKENCTKDGVSCEPDRMFRCRLKKIQHWDGHDGAGYVSAAIESPELQAEHERLKSFGCVPTFSPYEPHVTLRTGAKLTEDLKKRMAEVTHNLQGTPELLFGNQFIGDQDN